MTKFLISDTKMFTILYCQLTILLILFSSLSFLDMKWIVAIPENVAGKAHFLTYYNSTYDLKIQYPYNWTIDQKQSLLYDDVTKIVGFINDPNELAGDFLISVHNLTSKYVNQTISVAELLNRTVEYYKGYYHDFNLIESSYNTTNSVYRVVWIDKEGPYTIKSMQIGSIVGNRAYLVRYYAELEEYPDNLSLLEKMLDSLTINNKTFHY